MTRKITILLLYILLLVIISPQNAMAADYGLSISPPLLRVHIKPGKSITQVFKVENLSQTDKTLIAFIVPFSEADEKGNPLLDPKASSPWLNYFSLVNTSIAFDKPFILQSGASEQLVLSLSVPENAPLKDIYATLVVSTYTNTQNPNFQGTSISAMIGSNMLITVSSKPFPDTVLIIEDFQPQEGSFVRIGNLYFADSITPLTFSAKVKNDGNFTAETKGVFKITANNRPVYLEGILPVNVIGKSTRHLLNISGETFKFNPSLTQVGLHKISLEIKTDNSNSSGSIEIFFFPLKLTLGLLVAIFLILTIVKFTAKQGNNPLDNH